tara:strand:- start:58132 stop:60594 length:2463 start_codon:yes stop_codon:yes gene_type:complete
MRKYILICLVLTSLTSCSQDNINPVFVLADTNSSKNIYIDANTDPLIIWAAEELSKDIESITGIKPVIIKASKFKEKGIYLGKSNDALIDDLSIAVDSISGKWEAFSIRKNNDNLVIIGSDVRGTVYGVFELAEQLGISPWQWWADVNPLMKSKLEIKLPESGIIQSPSVQYRGIFLNDEDWGLQPWAAKTFEKEVGDIGPKTYEKIFQLLLRLKANTIWPAMHPCTQGFFTVDGNKEMAQKYKMVIGTSHAEPMLRNNVSEWNQELGDYNYVTNSRNINAYWQSRLDEVKKSDNSTIMTLGMRGIHDSGMEGIKSRKEGMALVEDIFANQRSMLSNTFKKPVEEIPQVFIPYKEVLDVYDEGMTVPDDVTLMWTDDNYGYIRRLSNEKEQKRIGGSGVYYHLSYWGRPHDYLWLSTTQPGLIWYEMSRAYANGAKKIWIANVGDIKPTEYTMEFFLDLAWDINSINQENINEHLEEWAARDLGNKVAMGTATIMNEYYRLAFLRKPEYMGWSQTEPTTPTQLSKLSSGEAKRRIASYSSLVEQVDSLKAYVPKERLSAWFQLIAYPVKSAANINYKFLYHQRAAISNDIQKQYKYSDLSSKAYEKIKELTTNYNNLEDGKWEHIMSMSPRSLPVFDALTININKVKISRSAALDDHRIYIQGYEFTDSNGFGGYEWKPINGFGYSNSALTLFPLKTASFKDEKPWVSYEFDAKEIGSFQLEIRFVPIHSNTLDQEVVVEIDDKNKGVFQLNTKGRSDAWKENVLQNSKRIQIPLTVSTSGKHTLKVYVNQTGIVIDQLAISPSNDADFYEIPLRNKGKK